MVTTVYLIRHCEALGNAARTIQGSTDCDISPKGALQLEKLTERCRSIPFDIVYSSPLIRALKTAEAAVGGRAIPILTDDGLRELHYGLMEERGYEELEALFPQENEIFQEDFGRFHAPRGESVAKVYERTAKSFERIVRGNPGKVIGIFSHGTALRALFAYLHGLPYERAGEIVRMGNTAISCVRVGENGEKTVLFENDYEHIQQDERTAVKQMWWGEEREA
ncbi:MAG: histidine phosphatase family protein [Bacteroides sp.]|nr:histidine phosphatase family protein [Eubacterium sp.]MCM1417193.1 histidine phosphatase family protein [Roseburia sp.]MCM1461186.1 histidine phosphatase family protein [Bacteroides sp.]